MMPPRKIFVKTIALNEVGGITRGVGKNVLDCDIKISEFEFQSYFYFHF